MYGYACMDMVHSDACMDMVHSDACMDMVHSFNNPSIHSNECMEEQGEGRQEVGVDLELRVDLIDEQLNSVHFRSVDWC